MTEYTRQLKQPAFKVSSRLPSIDIELTERCNNDCIHCCINLPAGDRKAKRREMDTEQVKAFLAEAAGLGCLRVRFTGGEPLLRPDFTELYLFARRLGLKVRIFTNGRLITPSLADLFARIPPLLPLDITVYGMHPESYEAVSRVPGSYQEFRCGVNLLLDRAVPFTIKAVLLPPNRHEMDQLDAWAKNIPRMKKPPSYSMFFDLRSRRDDPLKNSLIESLRLSPEDGLTVLERDWKRFSHDKDEFASKFMGRMGNKLFGCGAGKNLCIDAYGRAQPCLDMRAPELTFNLLDNPRISLAEALERFSHLHQMRAVNPAYLERCAACILKGFCKQCPAKSWTEHSTLDTPVEYYCRVAHAQARRLGWLGPEDYGWQNAARQHFDETLKMKGKQSNA